MVFEKDFLLFLLRFLRHFYKSSHRDFYQIFSGFLLDFLVGFCRTSSRFFSTSFQVYSCSITNISFRLTPSLFYEISIFSQEVPLKISSIGFPGIPREISPRLFLNLKKDLGGLMQEILETTTVKSLENL